jgi:hypothetical protein
MVCENNSLNEKLTEQLLDCKEELKDLKNESDSWLNSLRELGEIQDAFKINEKFDLGGKTVLDVGTDAVKPLYIALKFKPNKIIGVNENLPSIASDIKLNSRLFIETKIGFYDCSFFEEVTFDRIREKEKMKDNFDFVLISKTLHHLRDGKCAEKHKHREDEKCCKYQFDEEKIFSKLLELGKRVIVYECFFPQDEDDDKVRGRGGYFTVNEWLRILKHLSTNYEVKFVRPKNFQLHIEDLEKDFPILRQVDCICFCVEEQKKRM